MVLGDTDAFMHTCAALCSPSLSLLQYTHTHTHTHTHSFTDKETESRRDGGGNQSGVAGTRSPVPALIWHKKMTLDPPQGNKIALEPVL